MKKDENNEILFDITNIKTQETYTLPSKGLAYNEVDGIPASITLRRMTTKEDKIRLRNESEDKVRKDILQACIVENNIDAGKLKLSDANFLLFKLRVLSLLEDIYKINCFCPRCTTNFIHEIELSKLDINYLTKDKMKLLKIELPFSKVKIDLKFPSLQDTINMGDKLREYLDRFPNADKNELIYTISSMLYIDKVAGQKLLAEELENWIDNLDILDNRSLRQSIGKLDKLFGFDEELVGKCPNCGNEIKHGLPITGELFNPSL